MIYGIFFCLSSSYYYFVDMARVYEKKQNNHINYLNKFRKVKDRREGWGFIYKYFICKLMGQLMGDTSLFLGWFAIGDFNRSDFLQRFEWLQRTHGGLWSGSSVVCTTCLYEHTLLA